MTRSDAGHSKRFGRVDTAACAALREQREASGLSRQALAYLAWQRLGARVSESSLAAIEGERAPVTPLIAWIYSQLATKQGRTS